LLQIAIEHKPSFNRSLNIVSFLIKHGININYKYKYGNTSLHQACRTYGVNIDVIKILIKNVADMDIENSYGISPYTMAIKNDMIELKSLLDSLRYLGRNYWQNR